MDGIQNIFIGVVCWMCVWVARSSRTIQDNEKKGIKVEFVQFVKTIGLGWVLMDARYVLIVFIFTSC